MVGGGGETAESGNGGAGGMSQLPWQQVPKFTPGTTNVEEYVQRLRFLKELWPPEHLHHLAPRAAFLVEGSAFQKVSRIAPEKLRSEDGIKLLVETLGGSWGKTQTEEKYFYFEQAMFQVQQKQDESNDSYLARHDSFFEELLSRKVTMEEIRAYVLLRHSALSPEDKKRVVVEAQGNLRYQETVKSIRLLGSRFFGELQGRGSSSSQGKTGERTKVYDAHMAADEDEESEAYLTASGDDEPTDEDILCYFLEQNDIDALYISEFEDSIVEAVQESNLAPVYTSYQEARSRLRDKARSRGFFPVHTSKGKGKGKARKGKAVSSSEGRRRSLVERIANSSCKICGARGHWKRECPNNPDREEHAHKKEVTHLTLEVDHPADTEMLLDYGDSVPYEFDEMENEAEDRVGAKQAVKGGQNLGSEHVCLMTTPKVMFKPSTGAFIASRLLMFDRKFRAEHGKPRAGPETQEAKSFKGAVLKSSDKALNPEVALVSTEGAEGVLDTGASRTVIGEARVQSLLGGLPLECRRSIRKASSEVTFRFGNSGVLTAKHALLLPAQGGKWIRVEVVPGNTPLLISNRLLKDMDAVIYVRQGILELKGGKEIKLRNDEKGLSLVDMSSLLSVPTDAALVTESATSKQQPQQQKTNKSMTVTTMTSSVQPIVDPESSPPFSLTSSDSDQNGPEDHVRRCQEGRVLQGPTPGNGGLGATLVGRGRRGAVRRHATHIPVPQRDAVGRANLPVGEVQTQLLRGHLRRRHELQSINDKEINANLGLGSILPELCPGQIEGSGASGGGRAQHGQEGGGGTEASSESTGGQSDGGGRRLEAMSDSRFSREGSNDVGASQERRRSQRKLPHEGGCGSRSDSSSAGSSSARAGGAGRGGGQQLSACESLMADEDALGVCARIDQKIGQIEALLQASVREPDPSVSTYRLPMLDLLEISLEPLGGQVSASIQKCGGRALYLCGNKLGSARDGYTRLWKLISMYEPQHIWINANKPWRSREACSPKSWPDALFHDLYQHQTEHGKHFHMEGGHDLMEHESPWFEEIRYGTLNIVHDPVELTGNKIPPGNNYLRKRRYIYTTSRQLHQNIDTRWSKSVPLRAGDPQDQTRHDTAPRTDISSSSRCRSHSFANQVANQLCRDLGHLLLIEELLVGSDGEAKRKEPNSDQAVAAARQVLKRRRLLGKQPPPGATSVISSSLTLDSNAQPTWGGVFQHLNGKVPVKKRIGFNEGDHEVTLVQQLMPDFAVKTYSRMPGHESYSAASREL